MKPSAKEPDKLRLQVFLSHNGVCSRRQAMEVIQSGRVTVGGRVCREPSTPVDARAGNVSVDGKKVRPKTYEYVLLNKPAGVTTTKEDRFAKKTVLDLLPAKFRHLSPVGRLDRETEGLLLLTNDGEAAYRLTHPKFDVEKIYFVRIMGELDGEKKASVEKGIVIDGRKTAPAKISGVRLLKDRTELRITIHEGRKRQVRRMFESVGHKVVYLKRTRQGPLALGELSSGKWRSLNRKEIEDLHKV